MLFSDYQPDDCLYPALVTPSGLTAVSKTFQILYKNEEIVLSDSFIFRLNMLVDSNKVTNGYCLMPSLMTIFHILNIQLQTN